MQGLPIYEAIEYNVGIFGSCSPFPVSHSHSVQQCVPEEPHENVAPSQFTATSLFPRAWPHISSNSHKSLCICACLSFPTMSQSATFSAKDPQSKARVARREAWSTNAGTEILCRHTTHSACNSAERRCRQRSLQSSTMVWEKILWTNGGPTHQHRRSALGKAHPLTSDTS